MSVNNIISYPLTMEGVTFVSHNIVGLYKLPNIDKLDKIIFIHHAFGYANQEQYEQWVNEKLITTYIILDSFSENFDNRQQASLEYLSSHILGTGNSQCYWENDRFILNTKYYLGFTQYDSTIAKLIEIQDANLVEIGNAPQPISQIYNDSKTYSFDGCEVKMASQFVMECRSIASGEVVWKLKLSAYLYTEVEERNGFLYFGTSGNGGRFYCVSLADGSILFNYNTGGTVCYLWYRDNVILANKKNKPILLDSKTGVELKLINIGKYTITASQQMLIKDDRLYMVASGKDAMYALCVSLI